MAKQKNTVQKEYTLTIKADSIVSTDKRFTMDNLSLGDYYKQIDAYFKKADGEIITRKFAKNERKNSNQILPRIAFQIFEKQIAELSDEDRENFPTCKYRPDTETIRGIYTSVKEYRKHRKTIEYSTYTYGEGNMFVIYSWNVFTRIIFAQECLKRFGEPGDQFVLNYRDKTEKELKEKKNSPSEPQENDPTEDNKTSWNYEYINQFSDMLYESKNIKFHGAPGTGKSYLSKEIASFIISGGKTARYDDLTKEQKSQMEFVQFHPSYDYSDFIEGLRPKVNDDGTMGFELRDGVFKKFVARARKNYEDSSKPIETIAKELSAQEAMEQFFEGIEFGSTAFKTITGNEFFITDVDDKHLYISIPGNANVNKLCLNLDEIRKMLESGQKFNRVKDITTFFGKAFATQGYSYDFVIYQAIKSQKASVTKVKATQTERKEYVFIIDEINRGEISKIFGELFFSVDPGYRGKIGEISTQYANLHTAPEEKFYIPDNVYIIGTMNDIDRSVDSFDFAMRRRFRFVELKADEHTAMLDQLNDESKIVAAKKRMFALNKAIAETPDLNRNYQIGASYFLKLDKLSFDQLWTDHLEPLLHEYVQGMYDEDKYMNEFAAAYGYTQPIKDETDEGNQA